jgi:hypothetical protein
MKIFNFIKNIFITETIENEKECKHDEYCPIYLSYLGEYKNENDKHLKTCKNPNKQYCTKYRLVDQTKWKTLTKEEKMEILKEMQLFNFVNRD